MKEAIGSGSFKIKLSCLERDLGNLELKYHHKERIALKYIKKYRKYYSKNKANIKDKYGEDWEKCLNISKPKKEAKKRKLKKLSTFYKQLKYFRSHVIEQSNKLDEICKNYKINFMK